MSSSDNFDNRKFHWLRRIIRNNMTPIPEEKARRVKKGLNLMYNILAWNAFGLVLYACFTGKADWAAYHGLTDEKEANLSPGERLLGNISTKNASIYRISGFNVTKVGDFVDGQRVNTDVNAEKTNVTSQ